MKATANSQPKSQSHTENTTKLNKKIMINNNNNNNNNKSNLKPPKEKKRTNINYQITLEKATIAKP